MQHDYDIANASGATVRADINAMAEAVVTQNSGASAPATTFAGMRWYDTTNGVYKRRNAANSGWIVEGPASSTMVQAKTAGYTAVLGDHGTTIDYTSSTSTLALTAAATLGDGWRISLRNSGTGIITVDPNGAETIDGAASIKVYPGEAFDVVCNGSSFKTIGRARSGEWELISSQSPSGASSVVITDLDSARWKDYLLVLDAVLPATDGAELLLRTSTDGGATYDSGISDYQWIGKTCTTSAASAPAGSSGTSGISLSAGIGVGNVAGEQFTGEIRLIRPGAGAQRKVDWSGQFRTTAGVLTGVDGGGERSNSDDVTALMIIFSSGLIASGNVQFYGRRA